MRSDNNVLLWSFVKQDWFVFMSQQYSALPIRSPLGDQGLLRRLFDHFWSPILGKVTLFDSNNQLTLNY